MESTCGSFLYVWGTRLQFFFSIWIIRARGKFRDQQNQKMPNRLLGLNIASSPAASAWARWSARVCACVSRHMLQHWSRFLSFRPLRAKDSLSFIFSQLVNDRGAFAYSHCHRHLRLSRACRRCRPSTTTKAASLLISQTNRFTTNHTFDTTEQLKRNVLTVS